MAQSKTRGRIVVRHCQHEWADEWAGRRGGLVRLALPGQKADEAGLEVGAADLRQLAIEVTRRVRGHLASLERHRR